MRSMESLLGAQEGRSGLKRGSPITKMSPGWFPPLGEGSEEQSQRTRAGQGTQHTSVFSTLCYGIKRVYDPSAASEQHDPAEAVTILVSLKALMVT